MPRDLAKLHKRQKEYRDRVRADPVKWEAYLQRHRTDYARRKTHINERRRKDYAARQDPVAKAARALYKRKIDLDRRMRLKKEKPPKMPKRNEKQERMIEVRGKAVGLIPKDGTVHKLGAISKACNCHPNFMIIAIADSDIKTIIRNKITYLYRL